MKHFPHWNTLFPNPSKQKDAIQGLMFLPNSYLFIVKNEWVQGQGD